MQQGSEFGDCQFDTLIRPNEALDLAIDGLELESGRGNMRVVLIDDVFLDDFLDNILDRYETKNLCCVKERLLSSHRQTEISWIVGHDT